MGSGDYVGILLWIYHCHEVSVDVLYPYPFTTFLCSGVIRDFFSSIFVCRNGQLLRPELGVLRFPKNSFSG